MLKEIATLLAVCGIGFAIGIMVGAFLAYHERDEAERIRDEAREAPCQ